jgi:glycosyltransferase involved in cell wall biosynthesis
VAGDAAEYFDPSSVEALAKALERVLRSRELQQTLRSKGLERVKLFSWEECARRTLEVYRSVLGR